MNIQTRAKEYAQFYESLNRETPLQEYANVFDNNVYFEDPFQNVTGIEGVYGIFQHMYASLHAPSFSVTEIVSHENCAYLRWDFAYQRSSKHSMEKFRGVSRVVFNERGKVLSHIDYWDAGGNVYEKIPLLGWVIRQIKKKIRS